MWSNGGEVTNTLEDDEEEDVLAAVEYAEDDDAAAAFGNDGRCRLTMIDSCFVGSLYRLT